MANHTFDANIPGTNGPIFGANGGLSNAKLLELVEITPAQGQLDAVLQNHRGAAVKQPL
jgi:hypothetical protein